MPTTHTICGMCTNNTCGLCLTSDGERITAVTGDRGHPFNQGRVCPMARAVPEAQADPQRLNHPLRRTAGGGWRRIGWEAALDEITERLGDIRTRHGAQAIAVYQGHAMLPLIRQGWIERFINLLGTPNLLRNDHLCAVPHKLMETAVYGTATLYGFDPEQVGAVVLWGVNPATSASTTLWHRVLRARRRKVPLVVIDPRRTTAAQRADLHLAPRPGSDAALALGLVQRIVASGRYAADFVNRWTVGFDALAERVAPMTPARVEALTGIRPADLERLADLLTASPPVHISAGNALEHHSNASAALHAICCLRALLGSLDVPGGHQFLDPLPLADMRLAHLRATAPAPLGAERYPFFVASQRFVPGDVFVETQLSGRPYPIRAALFGGGNPLLTWPNTTRLHQALERLEFMVAMDIRMTATCRQADLVLPMAAFWEKHGLIAMADVPDGNRPCHLLGLQRLVVDPGERRSDWWLFAELARRLGHGAHYPWSDVREAIDAQLAPLGLTFAELEAAPHGLVWGTPHTFGAWAHEGFATPSGKVELRAARLAEHGHDPLPTWSPPAEPPDETDYPLILNAGRRSLYFAHSQFRDLASLARRDTAARAEIHPGTAAGCGVQDGDRVVVESRRGRIELTARVTDAIVPGVVNLLHGWPAANANRLTDHLGCDPVLACAPLRSGACRLRPADTPANPSAT